jgi:hypothetical protein
MRAIILSIVILFTLGAGSVRAAEGDTLWTRHYGGDFNQVAYDVSPSGDGGCVMAGYISHEYATPWNMYAIRMAANGDTVWTREYGTDDFHEEAHTLCPSGDGGYMLAGYTNAYGPWSDIELRKIDGAGQLQWTTAYGGSMYEVAYAICPAYYGGAGFLMAGKSGSYAGGELYLICVSASGYEAWWWNYGNSSGIVYDIVPAGDGGYVAAGYLDTWTEGSDAYVFKVNAAGDPLWEHAIGGAIDDFATSVCPAGDGGFLVAGYTSSFGAGSWDMYLIKVDADGDTLWTRTLGGPSFDQAWDIIPANDGNFLLAGHTGSYGAGNADFYLVKVDPAGNLLWSRTYGGADEDKAEALCASGDGHYYLAGKTASFTTPAYFDAYIIKVDGTVLDAEIESPQVSPGSFALYPLRPNPFNASTVLSFELRVASQVSLKVYDTAGRSVASLVEGWRDAGEHQVTFDGSNLATGIYLARLETGSFSAVQKLVLLK